MSRARWRYSRRRWIRIIAGKSVSWSAQQENWKCQILSDWLSSRDSSWSSKWKWTTDMMPNTAKSRSHRASCMEWASKRRRVAAKWEAYQVTKGCKSFEGIWISHIWISDPPYQLLKSQEVARRSRIRGKKLTLRTLASSQVSQHGLSRDPASFSKITQKVIGITNQRIWWTEVGQSPIWTPSSKTSKRFRGRQQLISQCKSTWPKTIS